MKVLMVCLGNICRSPTAEVALRAEATRRGVKLHVESRGTSNEHRGQGADARSARHALARGLDLSAHRARQVQASDFEEFDLIYAMDHSNRRHLLAQCPDQHKGKIRMFLRDDAQVPDPWFGGPAGFDEVLDMCAFASVCIVDEIEGSGGQ